MLTALRPIRDRFENIEAEAHAACDALAAEPDAPVALELSGREAAAVMRAIAWHVALGVQMAQQTDDQSLADLGLHSEIDKTVENYDAELNVIAALTAAHGAVQVPDVVPAWLNALGE